MATTSITENHHWSSTIIRRTCLPLKTAILAISFVIFTFSSIILSHLDKRFKILRPDFPLADLDGAKMFFLDQNANPVCRNTQFFRYLLTVL